MNETYLYPYSAAEANKRNELALWRESHKANIACRNAIEETIRQNFDGMNLKEKCIQPVLDEYGYKRTASTRTPARRPWWSTPTTRSPSIFITLPSAGWSW